MRKPAPRYGRVVHNIDRKGSKGYLGLEVNQDPPVIPRRGQFRSNGRRDVIGQETPYKALTETKTRDWLLENDQIGVETF